MRRFKLTENRSELRIIANDDNDFNLTLDAFTANMFSPEKVDVETGVLNTVFLG